MTEKLSVCSLRRPVLFYWTYSCANQHVDEAVRKLMESIERPDRARGNLYVDMHNEASFRERLNLARRGGLVPIDHVKQIQRAPKIDMFEIRWQDLHARLVDPVSGLYGEAVNNIPVRLYFVECGEQWVVGLSAHEKVIGSCDEETRNLQNERIDTAVAHCEACATDRWGVPELADWDPNGPRI